MKDIYIYANLEAWLNEQPTTSIKGTVISKDKSFIEIYDENNYTQLINLTMVFAIVY